MAPIESISRLGSWEGYEVREVLERRMAEARWLQIRLEPLVGAEHICDHCGGRACLVHERIERCVRDLPCFDAQVELIVPRLRTQCPQCGPRLERLAWLAAYARVTQRLAGSVARLCAVMSIRHVAGFYGLDWKTVKAIDRRHLERTLGPVDLSGLTVIAMDEFAIQRGHRYATVIVEPYRKRVLWVGRGRSREELAPFFEQLGRQGCAALPAVVMDMNASFAQEVRAHCPNARIVYDLFHILAKYGREVIDRVRWMRRTGCARIAVPATLSRAPVGCCFEIART